MGTAPIVCTARHGSSYWKDWLWGVKSEMTDHLDRLSALSKAFQTALVQFLLYFASSTDGTIPSTGA
jgi:hypothetical protein